MPTPIRWYILAQETLDREQTRPEPKPEPPVHTRHGVIIGSDAMPYIKYGETHDYDCPGCIDTPFTQSPRSETYWSS